MSINFSVRWADNTAELKRNLAQGLDQIEATRAAVDRLSKSLSGENQIKAANNWAAALQKLGGEAGAFAGVEKLTFQELERGNAVLDRAVQKYLALGQAIPTPIAQLHELIKAEVDAGHAAEQAAKGQEGWIGSLKQLNGLLGGLGIGLSVGAAVAFGKAIFEDADSLVKLSDKTGISIEGLQRLQVAGDDAGTSLDAVTSAVNMMQKRMVGGEDTAVAAMAQLGLRFEDIRKQAPDQQVMTIADAIRAVKDPAEQTALAVSIFGKGATEVLPLIKRGFDDVRDAAVGMSEQTARELDRTGDEIAKFWRQFKGESAEAAGFIIRHFAVVDDSAATYLKTLEKIRDMAEKGAPKTAGGAPPLAVNVKTFGALPSDLKEIDAGFKENEATIAKARAKADAYALALKNIRDQLSGAALLKSAQDYEKALASIGDVEKLSSDNKKKLVADFQKLIDQYRLFGPAGKAVVDHYAALLLKLEPVPPKLLEIEDGFHGNANAIEAVGKQLIPTLADLARFASADDLQRIKNLESGFGGVGDAITKMGLQIKPTMNDIGQGLKKAKDPADELGKAFEQLGRQIGGAMGDSVSQIGFFITKMKDAKDASDKWAAAIQLGLSIGGAFTTPGSRGSNVATYAGQGAAIGTAILPGYGTAVGAGVGALVGALKVPDDEKAARDAFNAFKRQVGGIFDTVASGQQRLQAGGDAWAKMVQQVTSAYEATGRTGADAMRDLEQATRHTREDVEKLPDDLARINEVLQQQQQDASDLQTAISKYGFTIEELGPAFQRQELTKQALQLENEFRLLVGAGADANVVLERMGGNINDFIHTALKTGTEVPAEMKPMLEQMAKMGTLTDASGEAITDLAASGLTFSETMTQGFDRVVTALEKVLRQLGYIDTAVDHIPLEKTIKIKPELVDLDYSRYRTTTEMPSFASGSQGIRDFGLGTLAVLHGREAVVTESQLNSGSVVSSGGGKTVILQEQFNFNVTLPPGGTRQADYVEKELMPEIMIQIEDRRRGYAGRMAQALEQS